MSQLEALLGSKVAEINSRKDKMEKVGEWINGYRGKIVSLKTGDKAYHIVFTKELASLRAGDYPSADITYLGEEDTLCRIISGETSAKQEARAGRVTIWQNLHEALLFESALSA